MGIGIAYDSQTLASAPTYTALVAPSDMSDVQEWEVDRGRQGILNRTEAGTANILLKNNDGKYDPTNVTSALYGRTLPLLPMQIAPPHPITGTAIPVFSGFIENWRFSRQRGGTRLADASVECSDGFELLGAAQVVPDGKRPASARYYAQQEVDDRIRSLLADAGWPLTRANIFAGNVIVQQGDIPTGTAFLQALFEAADAEFPGVSNCYMSRAGDFRFRGRFDRFNAEDYTVAGLIANFGYSSELAAAQGRRIWDLGDDDALAGDSTRIPIYDMAWDFGKDSIINTFLCTPDLQAASQVPGQRYTGIGVSGSGGPASRAQYGERAAPSAENLIVLEHKEGIDSTGANECYQYAQWYVEGWCQPMIQISSLEVHGHMAELNPAHSNIWDFCMMVEIGDICTVVTGNPGNRTLASIANGTTGKSAAGLISALTTAGVSRATYWVNELHQSFGAAVLRVTLAYLEITADELRFRLYSGTGGGINSSYFVEGIHHKVRNMNDRFPRWETTVDLSPRDPFLLDFPVVL